MSEQTSETAQTETPKVEDQASQQEASNPSTTQDEAALEATEESEPTWDPERAKDKIRKINSENRSLRERAVEAEKKAAAVPDLETQNASLASENLRLSVGYELGLPINLAVRLRGATRDELVADAESLVELVAPNVKPTPGNPRPTAALKPGASAEAITPPEDDSYPSHWLPARQRSN